MNAEKLCPLCEEGHLHEHGEKTHVEYNGRTGAVDSLYSVCDACGAEQATAEQLRTNKRAMIAFKKAVDGLLTGAELRVLRERLGITQAQAAKIFGGGPVAFSKYESDDVMQSDAMDKLLRLADAIPAAFAKLARDAGIAVPSVDTHSGGWEPVDWQTDRSGMAATRPTPHLQVVRSSVPDSPQHYQDYKDAA
ncbi:MAG: type II toxin-antitoxin system MqsA family antitoxin [Methylococcaceae bacterium]|nr:type II toxin-antitoxin system MqsA family antitoxin [Methylococcaceae bacterium]